MEPQSQSHQPGLESQMHPRPECDPLYPGVEKFLGQVVMISGGDSGIGRATALAFANEGASISIIYKEEDEDAEVTKRMVQNLGSQCILIRGDVGSKSFCAKAVRKTIEEFDRLDVLVNNAGEQHVEEDFEKISEDQLLQTFRTNIFSFFFLTQEALPHIKERKGSLLFNASVNAYKGNKKLMDYTATKGAIVALVRSLSENLAGEGVRVNGVAPGPIWTPLIPASFDEKEVKEFGKKTPLKRPGQPNEVAGCFTFLASKEASYMTGQVLHPNGGIIVNS
jgi:NAD(P)-dependent dehydrogenase (short-subunit alcohol dehydrogenase family)